MISNLIFFLATFLSVTIFGPVNHRLAYSQTLKAPNVLLLAQTNSQNSEKEEEEEEEEEDDDDC